MPISYQSVTSAIDILFSSNSNIVTLDVLKYNIWKSLEDKGLRKLRTHQTHQCLLVIEVLTGTEIKAINIKLSLKS